jgi:hypothetical protein
MISRAKLDTTSFQYSDGDFTLVRTGDVVKVTGTIKHNFYDRYDWELGLSVFLGGQSVSDEDMKMMEVYKGAKPFDTNVTYNSNITRNISV